MRKLLAIICCFVYGVKFGAAASIYKWSNFTENKNVEGQKAALQNHFWVRGYGM